jgi:hypothetical protein
MFQGWTGTGSPSYDKKEAKEDASPFTRTFGTKVPAMIWRCEAASPYRQKRQDFKKQDSREEAASSLSSLETEK